MIASAHAPSSHRRKTVEQKLYLARHAHAISSTPDAARPLSDKGHRQVAHLVSGLVNKPLFRPTIIWHSGLLRSIETATGIAKDFATETPMLEIDGLAPYDDPSPIIAQIDASSHSILIVGHEPNLSALSSILLTGSLGNEYVDFGKASILCLSRFKVTSQSTPWQILWHLSHKHFK